MVLQITKSFAFFSALFCLSLLNSGCYYDKEELLYPDTLACDTTAVSYMNDIEPVINLSCYGCHSNDQSQVAGAGISLEGHSNFSSFTSQNTDRFLGAVKHEASYSPMPKGTAKLTECEISKLEAWFNDGRLNN